jgi:hypothetical protein
VKNIPGSIHAFVIEPPRAAISPVEVPALEPEEPRSRALPRASHVRGKRAWVAGAGAALVLAAIVAGPGLKSIRTAVDPGARPPSNLASIKTDAPASDASSASPAAPGPESSAPAADFTVRRQPTTGPMPAMSSAGQKPSAPPSAAPGQTPPVKTAAVKPARPPEKPAEKPAEKLALPADPVAALAALSKDGIVAEPTTIAELYHNARLQEGKDKPAALRSYAALLAKSTEFLDVDLRYAGLLRSVNGVPAARATFAELARSGPSKALALVSATQAEPVERRGRLEALAADDPDFAPTSYFLAEDYMTGRQSGPTLTERRLAFDALNTFLETSTQTGLAGAFLDRSVLTAWREAASKRQSEIEASFAGLKTRTTATFARAETGWTVSLSLPEPALGIVVRLGEQGEFRSTGTLPSEDPRTGQPMPRTTFEIPAVPNRATLYVGYTDVAGHAAGPFPIQFDPATSLIASSRDTLERFPESWVTFRSDLPALLSVTQLVSNRCAISRALIGFGDDAPKEPLPLPPCNEQNPYAIPANARSVLNIPPDTETVQVKLTYADGTESTVRTFRRP